MSVADILISLATFLIQKLVIPLMPTNLPGLSFEDFQTLLLGNLQNNLIHSLSGLASLFNLEILFVLIGIIIFAEITLFLVRIALFVIKIVRG